MIRNTLIDQTVNRLLSYFGPLVRGRPHATAAELAELEAITGPLPRDLTIFLSTCNGLRVEIEEDESLRHIWNTREMIEALKRADELHLPEGLLPLRGDPEGETDCLVLSAGPMQGAVVRWDASASGAFLVATSFGRYLARWTCYVLERFDEAGHLQPLATDLHFSADYRLDDDPELPKLRSLPEVVTWLHRLDLGVPCGDDFE